jgi:glycosyltransferase involved in cell wall biosynthesis
MRIAQLAPLAESVPPKYYGGTERIVSYLTEELVRQGHEVTLFASGDSETSARLQPMCSEGLRKANGVSNPQAPFTMMLEKTFSSADQFDLFHSHLDFLAFPLARRCGTPVLTTLHGRLDLPELKPLFAEFLDCPLISISDAQRKPLAWANVNGPGPLSVSTRFALTTAATKLENPASVATVGMFAGGKSTESITWMMPFEAITSTVSTSASPAE